MIALGSAVTALYTFRSYVLNREGQITDRYTKAIDQLGSTALDVRLGGIYALERLMRYSPADQPTIVEVLAAYVREHARRNPAAASPPSSGPAADVQAALTVLSRRPEHPSEPPLDLGTTCLNGADLSGARLTYANLGDANLGDANLGDANLSRANLGDANLTRANLGHATLTEATLTDATLTEATLSRANLTRAILGDANLTSANLTGANLTNSFLGDANLTDAFLAAANLTGANLTGANLTGADLTGAEVTGARMDTNPASENEEGPDDEATT